MTSTPLNVLFIVPSLKRGGAEVQVVELVSGLHSANFSKHLFTFEPGLDLLDRLDRANVLLHHWPRTNKYDYRSILEIAKIIDRHSIDIVHCTLQMSLLRGWLGARLSKRKPKLVVTLHTTVNISKKAELLNLAVMQWLMRSCDKVICVCHSQEKHWLKKFSFLVGRTRVIYNGIDTDKFNPDSHRVFKKALRDQLGISYQATIFCHIAGFRPEKGHSILLEAFSMLALRDKNAFLLFVGDGSLRHEIEERVRKANLTSRIYFLGNLADVRPAIAASDCTVLASTAVETFSIAMLESLAMGVPMVATNIGGTAEAVLHGETGLLVPANKPAAMADALTYMLEHYEKRRAMGAAARDLVITNFSAAKMISETERTLTEIVESP